MLDGQRQGVDIPVHAITAHNGLLQKKNKKTGRRSRRPDQSTGCTELDNKEDLNRQRQLSPGMRVNTRQINITKVNAKAPRSLLTDQSSRNNFVCHVTSAV